uniref:beta-1,2-glucosyltransferase n=1 Tax=Ignavibacterium album (strain DSM 19864 / JCM 16511 / NBRC 101810 / Mat9-16) TaxID=945713 RepID=UPI001F0CDDA1|nr:Chain A, beta-1,2-glucosyltransferase [Ignavibacterium album JCM 16511]7VKZ_B Chain B, beta-1,2-glucosyltransferase [Ignavibacterium album JCM 16511]
MKPHNSEKYFVKNGQPHFLISGEVHYFRINPKLWRNHLQLLKQTGADTVSTYIPWDWHEIEEDDFDFEGKTHPARNLIRFIKLCKEENLDLIVKPGPYILAEYENQGLPSWLLKKLSKNAFALDENGNVISPDLVSYLSDEFLEYTFKWYDKVMPIISKHQKEHYGPITMMQLCNEIGVFQWLSGKSDYNPKVINLYKEFIIQRYKTIEKLNSVYSTNYNSFDDLKAPSGKIKLRSDYCAYFDFHLFFREYYNKYISILKNKIRSFGINIKLTHNIPGWIYGNASELPMLISTYSEIMKNHPDIIFGLDHIPEFVSFRNAHSDLACNKILEAMQPEAPVWAAGFQAGTREHHVKAYAKDLETFYIASLAHGIKGFNYYMFSQGINPEGKGFYGKTFYFQTALDAASNKLALYDSIKKVNRFIRKEQKDLLRTNVNSEICVGFYKPYFFTELISSQLLKEKKLNVEELGLYIDPRFLREEILFNGLLRGLQTLNYNYDVVDLENCDLKSLTAYKQLWITSAEFMDAETQNLLSEFVLNGGNLILYPAVPTLDNYLNRCEILKNNFGIEFITKDSSHKVSAFGIEDVFTAFSKKQIYNDTNSKPIAFTQENEICGIRKKIGKGELTILGFAFGYTSDEHLELIDKLVKLNKIKRELFVSDKDIQFVVRENNKSRYIFFLNYHNERKTFNYRKSSELKKKKSEEISIAPFSYKVIKENKLEHHHHHH